MFSTSEQLPIPSVAELNRDMEPYVIQAAKGRNPLFEDPYQVLQFVHFTDIHHMLELWNRLIEYVNTYSDYIQFALHTGDYVGCSHTEYYCDLYGKGISCNRPLLNCVGNHDFVKSYAHPYSTPKETYEACFPKSTDDWGVTFMEGEYKMNYYKDFPESNLRLIVLDYYFGGDAQLVWFEHLLEDARQKGMHVITAAHEMTQRMVEELDVPFQTYDDFWTAKRKTFDHLEAFGADRLIAEFKQKGGIHVCHLAGNEHTEYFGITERGVLNVIAPCGSYANHRSDCERVRGTRTYDCFNVVAVDTNVNVLKLIRIGNNVDPYLRTRKALCWDYKNGKMISSL